MPDQFVVPQFIDSEDKIIGPVTVRQFIIMLVTILTDAVFYKLLPFSWFIFVGVVVLAFGGIVAFARINGMPFHYFLLNISQTFRRPGLRVWDKEKTNAELKVYSESKVEEVPLPPERKTAPTTSRLQELTLVVDTGGVYKPEEEE